MNFKKNITLNKILVKLLIQINYIDKNLISDIEILNSPKFCFKLKKLFNTALCPKFIKNQNKLYLIFVH